MLGLNAGSRVDTHRAFRAGLSESSTAAIIGYMPDVTGANARTLQSVLDEIPLSIRHVLPAAGDGETDCAAAIEAIQAQGDPLLARGEFVISTDITLTGDLIVQDAQIIVRNGAQIDFGGHSIKGTSSRCLIIDDGEIVNMGWVEVDWFAGHLKDQSVDATAVLQLAADACSTGGVLNFRLGWYGKDGNSPVVLSKGQQVFAVSPDNSGLLFLGDETAGLAFQSVAHGSVTRLGARKVNPFSLAEAGNIVSVNAAETVIWGVRFQFAWNAVVMGAGSMGSKLLNSYLTDSQNIGWYATETNDVYLQHSIISAPMDTIAVEDQTGVFQAGEVIYHGTNFASAEVIGTFEVQSGTVMRAQVNHDGKRKFVAGDLIKGMESGAEATVVSVSLPHQTGGIRFYNKVEAAMVGDVDVIGGRYAITTDAAVNAPGVRPAYCFFQSVLFDSASEGALFRHSVGFELTPVWFSNRPSRGGLIEYCDDFLVSGSAYNCATDGLEVSHSVNIKLIAFDLRGNNRRDAGAGGLKVTNLSDVKMIGGQAGNGAGDDLDLGMHDYGISVAAGCRFKGVGADLRGNTSPVSIAVPSTDIQFAECDGYVTENHGTSVVTTDAFGQALIPHGLSVTPSFAVANLVEYGGHDVTVNQTTSTDIRIRVRSTDTGGSYAGEVTVMWKAEA